LDKNLRSGFSTFSDSVKCKGNLYGDRELYRWWTKVVITVFLPKFELVFYTFPPFTPFCVENAQMATLLSAFSTLKGLTHVGLVFIMLFGLNGGGCKFELKFNIGRKYDTCWKYHYLVEELPLPEMP